MRRLRQGAARWGFLALALGSTGGIAALAVHEASHGYLVLSVIGAVALVASLWGLLVVADRARRADRATLDAVLVASSDPMAQVAPDGRITWANAALCELVGRPLTEVLGLNVAAFTAPDEQVASRERLQAARSGRREGYVVERALVRPDGSTIAVRVGVTPVWVGSGPVTSFVIHVVDLSPAHAAMARLAEDEARMRAVLAALPDMVFRIGADDRFGAAHGGTDQYLVPPEEFLGRRFDEVLPRPVADRLAGALSRIRGGASVEAMEYELELSSGRAFFEARLVPVGTGGDVLGVVRDVTAERRTAADLATSEARNRAVIDALPDLLVRVRGDGTYLDVHAGDPGDLYAPAERRAGRRVDDVLPSAVAEQWRAAIARALTEPGVARASYALDMGDDRRHFEARFTACGPDEVLVVVRNTTSERAAEAEAQRRASELRSMLGAVPDTVLWIDGLDRFVDERSMDEGGLFGDASALLGRHVRDALVEPAASLFAGCLRDVRRNGRVQQASLEGDYGGRPRAYELRFSPAADGFVLVLVRDVTAARGAESARRASEARLRATLSGLPDLVFRCDAEGRCLEVYTSASPDLLRPADELVGMAPGDLFAPDLAAAYDDAVRRAARTGEVVQFSYALDEGTPQEQHFDARLVATPEREVLVVVRNTSELQRVAAELRASEARLRATLMGLPDLVFRYSSAHVCLEVFAGDASDLTMPYGDQVGTTSSESVGPVIGAQFDAAIDAAFATGEVQALTYELVLHGEVRHYDARFVRCLPDEVVCVVRNVTATFALSQSQREYMAVFEHGSAAVMVTDLEGRFLEANPAACALLGRSVDELRATSVFAVTFPEERAELVAGTLALLAGERDGFSLEGRVRRDDGEVGWVMLSVGVIRDAEGIATRLVGQMQDVSDRRRAEAALAEREERFRTLTESAPIVVFLTDAEGAVTYVNARWAEVTGRPVEAALGQGWWDTIHPADRHLARGRNADGTTSATYRVVRPDGGVRWLSVLATPLESGGGGFVGTAMDVTHEVEARAAADRALGVLDATTDYVMILDAHGHVTWANQAAGMLLSGGLEGGSRDVFDLLTPESRDVFRYEAMPEVERSGLWRGELELELGFGFTVPVSQLVIADRDEGTGAVVSLALVARDITEVKEAQTRLTHLATHDALTGLPNRMLFMDRLRISIERARRTGASVAVLFCDLDGFKQVNDRLGHDAGDALLVAIAERMQDAVRTSDTVARLGGDEFVVLCDDLTGREDVVGIARRVVAAAQEPVITVAGLATVGVSIGVAFTEPGVNADELLTRSDTAMYEAKAAGKGCVRVYGDRATRA